MDHSSDLPVSSVDPSLVSAPTSTDDGDWGLSEKIALGVCLLILISGLCAMIIGRLLMT